MSIEATIEGRQVTVAWKAWQQHAIFFFFFKYEVLAVDQGSGVFAVALVSCAVLAKGVCVHTTSLCGHITLAQPGLAMMRTLFAERRAEPPQTDLANTIKH